MSETSTLISCTGRITRAELAKLPTPPTTETHIPIPHAAVVETLVGLGYLTPNEYAARETTSYGKDACQKNGKLGKR